MIIVGGADRSNALHQSGTLSDGSLASAIHLIWRPTTVKPQAPEVGPNPHAFVVKQAPGAVLNPHFHFHRQFQVVVRGSGKLGHHELQPGAVHYAAAETAYGPIVAGPDGLWYMTLRQVTELGAQYLPADVDKLQRGLKRRQFTSEALPAHDGPVNYAVRELIAVDESGLSAWLLDVPADAVLQQPEGEGRADRYYVVVDGLLNLEADILPELSVIWVDREEPLPSMRAGDDGVRVVIVQFPHVD